MRPVANSGGEWHEAPQVTITRLVCQLVLSVGVLTACGLLVVNHPEHAAGAAMAAGVVLGAWFGVVREGRLRG
jgi:hypothetical protein